MVSHYYALHNNYLVGHLVIDTDIFLTSIDNLNMLIVIKVNSIQMTRYAFLGKTLPLIKVKCNFFLAL